MLLTTHGGVRCQRSLDVLAASSAEYTGSLGLHPQHLTVTHLIVVSLIFTSSVATLLSA